MDVAMHLLSGFVECLLLVLAVAAVRRGRPIYWAAVVGVLLVLYARMADGFLGVLTLGPLNLPNAAALTVVGLVIAALTVLADLVFEIVEDPREEPNPSV